MTIYIVDMADYRANSREIGAVWRRLVGAGYPAMAGIGWPGCGTRRPPSSRSVGIAVLPTGGRPPLACPSTPDRTAHADRSSVRISRVPPRLPHIGAHVTIGGHHEQQNVLRRRGDRLERPIRGRGRVGASLHTGTVGGLDTAVLRHLYEPSRFALALVGMAFPIALAIFVLVSLGEATMLVVLIIAIGLGLLLIWLLLQVCAFACSATRSCVRETLPSCKKSWTQPERGLATRDRSASCRGQDAHGARGGLAPITLTQFFGIRVLVVEGASLGDLADEKDRQRLSRSPRTSEPEGPLRALVVPHVHAFHMTGLTALAQPLINPYYRATASSGTGSPMPPVVTSTSVWRRCTGSWSARRSRPIYAPQD